jgi:putative addiction module component (TIGR02574 family)
MSFEQVENEALNLNAHNRAILAQTIWESLEDPYTIPSDITDSQAIKLAKKRDNEIEQGKVKSLSHQELMSRLR